jgi:NAD(P)-dependent dehydrogenase (short-subunit alcohol dehydrogenase family)
MVHERTLTPEGVETNFATNTLGTYALTEGLLPSLERTAAREKARDDPSFRQRRSPFLTAAEDFARPASAFLSARPRLAFDLLQTDRAAFQLRPTPFNSTLPQTHARVIAVSSAGMLTEKLESRDVEASTSKSFDGTRQYAKGKRHQVALTERWARLAVAKCGGVGPPADGSGAVGFYAMHPGWCDTDAVKVALPGFYERLKGKLRSPREGADTAAWLCVAPAETLVSGEFYLDRAVVPKHVWSGSWFGTTYSDAEVDALAEKLEARLREALSARR